MFTGIIETTGKIKRIVKSSNYARLVIEAPEILDTVKIGDSIATDGVCLTVTELSNQTFGVDVMNESLARSTLGNLKVNGTVNLERAMPANGRFDGHIVSGHIDGIGTIVKIQPDGIAVRYTIKTTAKVLEYIVEKGSIAIDGISLTVIAVARDDFTVGIIPHTNKHTTLTTKPLRCQVNLENDVIGKYVEKFLMKKTQKNTLEEMLKNGY